MNRHEEFISRLSAQVSSLRSRNVPFRISHGSTNSTRPRPSSAAAAVVDISPLKNILSIDQGTKTCLVEPNVPMDQLVSQTLKHGLVPPVVMEFPGITAGGGFAGTAGESSSFRHGFWDDTVDEAEMVLGDGSVVNATPTNQYADLFRAAAGAVGTLGITTLLKVRLVDALPFVKTSYTRSSTVADAIAHVRKEASPDRPADDPSLPDFVDGIIYSPTHAVTVTGRLAASIPATPDHPGQHLRPRTFSGRWDPWFYLHAESLTAHLPPGGSRTEYVPLAEYLFRYDRGGFWVARAGFLYFYHFPFNRLTRAFADGLMHTRMLYRALHGSGESRRFIVQDLALPYASAEEFVGHVDRELGIWPLWLCPLRQRLPPTFHPHTGVTEPVPPGAGSGSDGGGSTRPQQMINIGVWGQGPTSLPAYVAANRALEAKVRELGGMKWFYAHTYYTEAEFWDMYDKPWYDALREKYRATTLPTVYEKVRVDLGKKEAEDRKWANRIKSVKPFGGIIGLWRSIQSKDYFLHRRAEWKYRAKSDETRSM